MVYGTSYEWWVSRVKIRILSMVTINRCWLTLLCGALHSRRKWTRCLIIFSVRDVHGMSGARRMQIRISIWRISSPSASLQGRSGGVLWEDSYIGYNGQCLIGEWIRSGAWYHSQFLVLGVSRIVTGFRFYPDVKFLRLMYLWFRGFHRIFNVWVCFWCNLHTYIWGSGLRQGPDTTSSSWFRSFQDYFLWHSNLAKRSNRGECLSTSRTAGTGSM